MCSIPKGVAAGFETHLVRSKPVRKIKAVCLMAFPILLEMKNLKSAIFIMAQKRANGGIDLQKK